MSEQIDKPDLCDVLVAERRQYDQAVMEPFMMKQAYYAAEMSVKGRVRDGRARGST